MSKENAANRLSPDAERIAQIVKSRTQTAELIEKAASTNPRLRSQADLTADLTFMAAALTARSETMQKLAIRALVRRVGAFTARRLIASTQSAANEDFKLTLTIRADRDRLDKGKARKAHSAELSAAELLELDTLHRLSGMPAAEAREKAIQELGLVSSGLAGAKKKIRLAQAGARARGFVQPNAPEATLYLGAPLEPKVTIADLPSPGRPRKGAK